MKGMKEREGVNEDKEDKAKEEKRRRRRHVQFNGGGEEEDPMVSYAILSYPMVSYGIFHDIGIDRCVKVEKR